MSQSKIEIVAKRTKRRESATEVVRSQHSMVADPSEWRLGDARWDGQLLRGKGKNEATLLESPPFRLERGRWYFFELECQLAEPCGVRLTLLRNVREIGCRSLYGKGRQVWVLQERVARAGIYRLRISGYQAQIPAMIVLSEPKLTITSSSAAVSANRRDIESVLPHWSWWQRVVHRLCCRSRFFNSVVCDAEMRAGKEELLSLPQYASLCPTGQCNASCGFCSVTTNRTGIIKKQLPFDSVTNFVSPFAGIVRLFGVEGNGEPTLYDRFDDLMIRLTEGGSAAYLITNGERLTDSQISLLLATPTDSINVSLNAATATTHRRVMKLKSFDSVVSNIRKLVAWRGESSLPVMSASFVVTRENVHEVQDFLLTAEWDLSVDRIFIRPLSEIANEDGSVEDLRELVPFESDIEDMLDAVEEYANVVPRGSEIVLAPETFKAFRADPVDEVISPCGHEDRLYAPRQRQWKSLHAELHVRWMLNQVELRCGEGAAPGALMVSELVSVIPNRTMKFAVKTDIVGAETVIAIEAADGQVLAACRIAPGDPGTEMYLSTRDFREVLFRISFSGGLLCARLQFGRLRTGRKRRLPGFRLPHSARWQIDTPGMRVKWIGSRVHLSGETVINRYIFRSYSTQCAPHSTAQVHISVSTKDGLLGIGVLNESAQRWIAQYRFDSPEESRDLVFETGENRKVQFVVYALSSGNLTAEIDWHQQMEEAPRFWHRNIDFAQMKLPPSANWEKTFLVGTAQWDGSKLSVCYEGRPGRYIALSSKFPCSRMPGARQSIRVKTTVTKGKLGIGFLGETDGLFIGAYTFELGTHERQLEANTYGQRFLRAVVFSQSGAPLEAEIDWLDNLSLPRDGTFLHLPAAASNLTVALQQGRRQAAEGSSNQTTGANGGRQSLSNRLSNVLADEGWSGIVSRALIRLPRYRFSAALRLSTQKALARVTAAALQARYGTPSVYCAKPWTDLNNFTVDGRVDVCCIATGESQKRYALGNLFKDDFQRVWNGERMREFRRTVNTSEKLPPCARCPMANNYKSPFA